MPFELGYQPSQFSSTRPGYDGTSLQETSRLFASEDACFDHVLHTRVDKGAVCSKCGKVGRWYRRRGFKYVQHLCGAVISPLAGTLFHATKLPLRLWFYAILHFANSREGVTVGFLQRQLGISYLAAFRMAHRIRMHMAALERATRHPAPGVQVHVRLETLHRVRSSTSQRHTANVLFAATQERLDCTVVSAPRRHSVRAAVLDLMPGHGTLLTSCYRTSRVMAAYGGRHPLASFVPTYFLDHDEQIDRITGFLSYFREPFNNLYKHVSREHLWLYLKEFQFRYNRRHRSRDTYWDMVGAFPVLFPEGRSSAVSFRSA